MKILRLLMIVVFGALLFMMLRLPDDWRGAEPSVDALPRADFRRLAAMEWKAGRHGAAVLLLNYVIENRLPDAAACDGAREGYLAVMETDRSSAGPLAMLGLDRPFPAAGGGFDSLSGVTVADWFVAGGATPAAVSDELGAQLIVARELTGLFPPAAPALRLTETVWRAGLLRDGLRTQLERALRGMAAADSSAAVIAVQETLMPLFQLARQCRTWAEFTVLLRHADSVDQLKLLTRMASLAPVNAVKLARPLIITEAENRPDMPTLIMDFIVRRGQAGMDAMDQALRRGTAGMDWLLRNPGLPASMLDEARPEYWPPAAWRAAWRAWHAQAGRAATLVKALAVLLLCMGILVCLLPGRMLRGSVEIPSSGTPPAVGARKFYAWYWMVVLLLSMAVGALLMLGGDRAPLAGAVPLAADAASAPLAAATASAYAPQQLLSWMVILVTILLVQGTCWELARRRIRNVAMNPHTNAAMKLRQLENLDIFFDLPLYAGLALTILAFILISTLGAGVSRFLAYASTFVGILFAVALRLGHLYPLREKLITQTAPNTPNNQTNVKREKN